MRKDNKLIAFIWLCIGIGWCFIWIDLRARYGNTIDRGAWINLVFVIGNNITNILCLLASVTAYRNNS